MSAHIIYIYSSSLRRPIHIEHVDACGQYIATSIIVRDLGVTIDADLSWWQMHVEVLTTISRELHGHEGQ